MNGRVSLGVWNLDLDSIPSVIFVLCFSQVTKASKFSAYFFIYVDLMDLWCKEPSADSR